MNIITTCSLFSLTYLFHFLYLYELNLQFLQYVPQMMNNFVAL